MKDTILLSQKNLEDKDKSELNFSKLYNKKLDNTHQKLIIQQEETILGVSLSNVERQCQTYYIKSPFDQPLNSSQDYKDTVIECGKKILNDPKTFKLVRNIYKNNK